MEFVPNRSDTLKLIGLTAAGLLVAPKLIDILGYNKELKKELTIYSKSFGFVEDEVIRRSLTVELTDIRDQKLKVTIDSETAIPLMIADERGDWMPAFRKELGAHCNRKFGIIIDGFTPAHGDVIKSEFSIGALSNDWGWREKYDEREGLPPFFSMDSRIEFCRKLGINDFRTIAIIGAGVPKDSIPEDLLPYVLNNKIHKDQLFDLMAGCIRRTMKHFKGMNPPMKWSVINEPFMRSDPYVNILGKDYVERMYRIARETNPNDKLIINLPNADWSGGEYTKIYLELVHRLRKLEIVDIVAQQMHKDKHTRMASAEDIQRTILSYEEKSSEEKLCEVRSIVSEDDNDIRDLEGSDQERALKQGEIAEDKYDAVLPVVDEVNDWGIYNDESWMINADPENPASYRSQAHDWNADGSPRPSYYTKRRAIFRYSIKPEQRALIGI